MSNDTIRKPIESNADIHEWISGQRKLVEAYRATSLQALDDDEDLTPEERESAKVRVIQAAAEGDAVVIRVGKDCLEQYSEFVRLTAAGLKNTSFYQVGMSANMLAQHLIERRALTDCSALCAKRMANGEHLLILIKAQHPLVDGAPGHEYRKRLNAAIAYCREKLMENPECRFTIMFVGGIHEGSKVVSLAEAGAHYFELRADFPYECIIRDKIYGGNDEDWEGAREFKRDERYTGFVVCCSDGQHDRSYLSCCILGVYPEYRMVTIGDLRHTPHQWTMLEVNGSWSMGGVVSEGLAKLFVSAAETAARHRAEAKA